LALPGNAFHLGGGVLVLRGELRGGFGGLGIALGVFFDTFAVVFRVTEIGGQSQYSQ
jgi:hypothetical protein